MSRCEAKALQRFQNCCTQEPQLLSGIFLKKMPPFATLKRAHEFWNRSSAPRLQSLRTLGTSWNESKKWVTSESRRALAAGNAAISM